MMIGKCPSCEHRLIVDIPKIVPNLKTIHYKYIRTCERCGDGYLLSIIGYEEWEPYHWGSLYDGLAMSFEGRTQEFSVDGVRIREPIYPEAKVAKFLGRDPRTLPRWRESGKIGYYRLGLSIFYGESHIRHWLWRHISNVTIPKEWQLDLALDCMRRDHSPFCLHEALKYNCPNGHWPSAKQMFAYLNGHIAKQTPYNEIAEEFYLIIGGIRDAKGRFILTRKRSSTIFALNRNCLLRRRI